MTDEFILREMWAGDGAAINQLNEESPDTGAVSFYTHYLHDPYETLMILHPGTVGVVAEVPGREGIAGMGLVTLSEGLVEGEMRPLGYLNSLKVHPDFRRQGLAGKLARWRIEKAREQMGDKGIIFASIQEGNISSLKAAKKWANHVFEERMMGVVATTVHKAARPVAGVEVQQTKTDKLEEIVQGINTFYKGYNLYAPESVLGLQSWLDEKVDGKPLHHYYVAVDRQGNIVAGLGVAVEGLLLQMHIRRMPPPLRIANWLLKMVPPDGTMRRLHVEKFWYASGQETAGRYLWEAVRFQAREDGTNLMYFFDPRSPIGQVITMPKFVPQPKGMIVLQSPVPINENHLLIQHT